MPPLGFYGRRLSKSSQVMPRLGCLTSIGEGRVEGLSLQFAPIQGGYKLFFDSVKK